MSEYRWRVRGIWIGVEDHEGNLLGVIRRSGTVNQVGHFCFVDVSVCGKKYTASGAEDRIFPFHSIKLEEGDKVPEFILTAVGWCVDGNTYAFKDLNGNLVEIVGAGSAENNLRPITQGLNTKAL